MTSDEIWRQLFAVERQLAEGRDLDLAVSDLIRLEAECLLLEGDDADRALLGRIQGARLRARGRRNW